ncbi:hypothetical protein ACHAWF_002280 [Thalassiosira exigua]
MANVRRTMTMHGRRSLKQRGLDRHLWIFLAFFLHSAADCRAVEAFAAGSRSLRSTRPPPRCLPRCNSEVPSPWPLSHIRMSSAFVLELRMSNQDDDYDPRDNFGRSIRGLQSSALKTTVNVGDTVVCKRSLLDLGIYENSSYEVRSIYAQYFDEETQQIVKQPLASLDDGAGARQGSQVYMSLFSPQHHSGEGVIVTPEEVGLVSVREELGNAAWLAVPGFFWVFVAASFYNTYHERTGGSFGDAFWGR